ncbi:hypothetical protein BGI40_10780 [Snodgrassella communis]|uniref:Uncharacterized protein n=1 Tax=Snodgrassella alvi TaxID=1196083 RepID=A0A2N9XAP2_9NEIS|nr:hypothetical protein BGI31_03915 [Snodgrassella communis]PIT43505.1 hypothetical protein BHC46_12480 [Snodgrassella alvi]PIT10464.1 hypothetical protein BGI29_02225 [Snodgrassella communis]PIT20561.1 hypothetical protein BGI36_08015 [Snodgrassella communis]PIT23551.1 hypothetical protein BGI35_01740 [Snodgrassella communis]
MITAHCPFFTIEVAGFELKLILFNILIIIDKFIFLLIWRQLVSSILAYINGLIVDNQYGWRTDGSTLIVAMWILSGIAVSLNNLKIKPKYSD